MTMMIDNILAYNKTFVEQRGYEQYVTDKYPNKKLAVLSCMDTRLTELLPAALGLKNGDAKVIKNAGGLVISPLTQRCAVCLWLFMNWELRRLWWWRTAIVALVT